MGSSIIAHASGIRKSLMVTSFIQSYLTLFPTHKLLIFAPKSTLHKWRNNFNKWNVNILTYVSSPLRTFTLSPIKTMPKCLKRQRREEGTLQGAQVL
jgi:SNF2 family DNA or RNA helicase